MAAAPPKMGGAVSSPATFLNACIRSNLPGLGWNLPNRDKLLAASKPFLFRMEPRMRETETSCTDNWAFATLLIYEAAHAYVHYNAKRQKRKQHR